MSLCDELLKINQQLSKSNSARFDPTEYNPEQNARFCICGNILPKGKDFCCDACELRPFDERNEIFDEKEEEDGIA